jgi:hypothetical protein
MDLDMNRSRKVVLFLLVGCLAFAAMFFMLPKSSCCEDDAQLERLTDAAAAGDLDAIEALYMKAERDGVQPMQEHWALEGALRGDRNMRMAYVELFNSRIEPARQQSVLAAIQNSPHMPGTSCLLVQLVGTASAASECN